MEIFDRGILESDVSIPPSSRSDDELLSLVTALVEEAKTEADHQRSEWPTLRDFHEGEGQGWAEVAPGLPHYLQEDWSVTNHVKASVQVYISTVMSAFPEWYVVALDGDEDEAAERTTTYLRAWQQVVNLRREEHLAVQNALIVGTGALQTFWDKRRKEVLVRSRRPEYIYPDPTAARLEDCSYLAFRNFYGMELAFALYPDLDLTEASQTWDDDGEIETAQETKASEKVEVWEVYYDFGKRLMIYSGKQKLFEGPNPMPASDFLPYRYPLFLFQYAPSEGAFWAEGLVGELKDPQNRINRGNTRISVHQRYGASPTWTTDDAEAKENFDATPGSINFHQPESKLLPAAHLPMPPDLFESVHSAKEDLDNIAGTVEVTRGIRPTGVNTGIALQVLHQAAQQRMTGPASDWTVVKGQVGQASLELMQKSYTGDRVLATVTGSDARRVELAADDLSTEVETGQYDQDGEPDEAGNVTLTPKMKSQRRNYRVVTRVGGDIPMSPAARAEMGLQLHQIPSSVVQPFVIDDESLMSAVQWPDRDKVLERREQMLQAQQQGEQEAAAAIQGQQQGAQAQQRMAQVLERLETMLPPEMLQFLEDMLAGTMTDEEMIVEFMDSLDPEALSLVKQYLALSQVADQVGGLQMAP